MIWELQRLLGWDPRGRAICGGNTRQQQDTLLQRAPSRETLPREVREVMLQASPCARQGCAWRFLPCCRSRGYGNASLPSQGLGGELGQGKHGDLPQGVTCPCLGWFRAAESRQGLELQMG